MSPRSDEAIVRIGETAEKYFRYVDRYTGGIGPGNAHRARANGPGTCGRDQKMWRTPVVTPTMFFWPGASG